MFGHYLKITWRSVLGQKLYALINIGGLAIGITCFILIGMYVHYELSFDGDIPNEEHIYRVIQRQKGNEYLGTDYFAVMPAPAAKTIADQYPEVEAAVALQPQSAIMGIATRNLSTENGFWAEKGFFEIFEPLFLHGNPDLVFDKPNGLVITRALSHKLFGTANSLGKLVKLNDADFEITGIVEDPPQNSSLQYNFIQSISNQPNYKEQSWFNNSPYVFLKLAEDANPKAFEAKLSSLLGEHQNSEDYPFEGKLHLEALSKIYFNTKLNFDFENKGNANLLLVLGLIAVIILMLACINYINLSIARSVKRSKEVGLRKAIGAGRNQIIVQFLGEAVFFSSLALLVALMASILIMPWFSDLIERPLTFGLFRNPIYLFGLVGLMLFVAFISGSYPALVVSRLRPGHILKGRSSKVPHGFTLQKILIIGQYTCSLILLVAGIVVYRQIQFINSKDLGYNKEHIISIPINNEKLRNNLEVLKNLWLSEPRIKELAFANELPTNIKSSTLMNYEASTKEGIALYEAYGDFNYIDIFDLEMIAGRKLSEDFAEDTESNFVFNETAARTLGYTPEEAVGKTFSYYGGKKGTIVGVAKDFNMHSLHTRVMPLYIGYRPNCANIVVKIAPQNIKGTLEFMESSIANFSNSPFLYSFLDEQFDQLYKAEYTLGKAINCFSVITLLLASFGLFGLAAIVTEQRIREVGIRKVLGASEKRIVSLLTSDFLMTVLIAFILAVPLSWYFMNQWLEGYAYRIHIGAGLYMGTGLAVVMITLLTVGYQALKGASMNPVEALRQE